VAVCFVQLVLSGFEDRTRPSDENLVRVKDAEISPPPKAGYLGQGRRKMEPRIFQAVLVHSSLMISS
jgi:hypothetical protein